MIRRRASLIGALATALPFARPVGGATTQVKVFRIGVLESEREVDEYGWKEFVAELSRLGFVEGQNVSSFAELENAFARTFLMGSPTSLWRRT